MLANVTVTVEFPIDDPTHWGGAAEMRNADLARSIRAVLDADPSQVVYLLSEYDHVVAVKVTTVRPPDGDVRLAIADSFDSLDGPVKLADLLGTFPHDEHDIIRIAVLKMLDDGTLVMNNDRTLTPTWEGE